MTDWPHVKVSTVCDLIVDCVNRTASVVPGPTPYKMIRTTNVRDGFIDTDNVRCVSEDTFHVWTRRAVPRPGDVVLTREAPLGEVGIIRKAESVFLGQRTIMYRAKSGILDPYFLLYSMLESYVQGQIRGFGSGSTVEHMRLPDCLNLEFGLPPIEIQKKIGAILSAYDDLIENNNRRIKLLEEMAQRIYREWFVDFRYPGHEAVPLVDSELGSIPEGWRVRPFTDLVDVLSGGTPRTTVEEFWNGKIPFFTPRDSPSTLVVTSTDKHVTKIGLDHCNSSLFQPGTVFITARGTVGKVVMAGVEMAMNQSCYAIRGRDGISQEFVLFSLLNQVDYLKTNTGGATFDTIIVDTFRRMLIAAPPSKLVHAYGNAVEPIMRMIRSLQIATRRARSSRDLLLPRLISGDIDVTSLDIVLAEAAA